MIMRPRRNLHLNLSRSPARNRLFFWMSLAVLAGFFFALSLSAGILMQRTGLEKQHLQEILVRIEQKIHFLRGEERRAAAAAQEAEKELGKTVAFINEALFRKAYRLTDILFAWETALPDGSHVSAFSPGFSGPSALTIKAKAVSRNLEDLHTLIENLRNQGFRNIRVESETQNDQGYIVADLVMSHERLF